jgi:hypothetical protein
MQPYDNSNRITLWKTTQEELDANPKKPTYKGSINITGEQLASLNAGQELEVSVWGKKLDSGKIMLSGGIQVKYQPNPPANSPKPAAPAAPLDDDIPF